ncbi:MAG: sterol desaturase family protein [Bacteroidia bacterium]
MQTYGQILNIAMPIFVLLFLIERFAAWRMKQEVMRDVDSISSLSSGMTNVLKDVLGLTVSIITYGFMLEHFALYHIKTTWLAFLVAFIAVDFQGYWAHRFAHEINVLWNGHVIHHSSEEFNLSCALRQSISVFVRYFTILLLPAALLGVEKQVVMITLPLHLFLQYWYHTRLIGKMGFLEWFLVTPSHHRVHHAMNKEYMNRNYGQIFIFWDRWFGSFQEELAEVPPVYGVTRPARTWNPLKINFQHLFLLIQDAWRTENLWDKARIWFMPTGWRPEDVKKKYPIYSVKNKDVYVFEKYETNPSVGLIVWSWTQLSVHYLLMAYFFAYFTEIGSPNVFIYGALVALGIYAYCELLDKNPYAMYWEGAKSLVFMVFIYLQKDWFGISTHFPWAIYLLLFYLFVSPIIVWNFNREQTLAVN